MIINPSPLLTGMDVYDDVTNWNYIPLPKDYNHKMIQCICDSCRPKKLVNIMAVIEPIVAIDWISVTLKVEMYKKNDDTVFIWAGVCNRCGAGWWTCNNWVWVSWLNDLDTAYMLCRSIPLKNVLLEKADYTRLIINQETTIDFHKGKIVRIQ